jgi:hypothetical protein
MSLSPKSTKMEIGVRSTKTIIIYPFSMADEFKFTSTISHIYQTYQELQKSEEDDVVGQVPKFIISAIEENLVSILAMVCEEEVTLNDITNEQFADICGVIYDMNFSGALGKFLSLWEKIKKSFPQTKQSQNSSLPPVTP